MDEFFPDRGYHARELVWKETPRTVLDGIRCYYRGMEEEEEAVKQATNLFEIDLAIRATYVTANVCSKHVGQEDALCFNEIEVKSWVPLQEMNVIFHRCQATMNGFYAKHDLSHALHFLRYGVGPFSRRILLQDTS